MWKGLLGERGSGKSVYIENYVKKIDQGALYIATLPELKLYRSAIIRHKKRRPSTWKCIELFKMTREEILTFPYFDYRNIILDNLSYYILYQIYFNLEEFNAGYDENIILLIKEIASDDATIVYFIDTPVDMDVLDVREKGVVLHFFNAIFENAESIEKFQNEEKVYTMAVEEAKKYFFHTDVE